MQYNQGKMHISQKKKKFQKYEDFVFSIIKMIIKKSKQMTDSLSPWDDETDNLNRPPFPKSNSEPLKQQAMHRYNSAGSRLRIRTSQKTGNIPRDIMKLQQRVPTESMFVPDWQVEIKAMGFLKNQVIIKIPNQFVTLPPKRQSQFPKKSSKSPGRNQAEPAVRQKVSFRNFKKEIEELDKLRSSIKTRFDLKTQQIAKGLMQISDPAQNRSSLKTFKRCSLQNINPFDEPVNFSPQRQQAKSRVQQGQTKKKHILDQLLSKYQ